MQPLSWQIDDVMIHQLVELEAGAIIRESMPDATPENIQQIDWLAPHFADKNGNIKALVQGFLIQSNDKNILIDTCNGNNKHRVDIAEWGNLQTNFLAQLTELGLTVKDINVVACTHLHMDHVGWNTTLVNDEWIPTFPNAQYLFDKKEYEYWQSKPEKEITDDKASFDDSVTPVVEAGLARLVESDYTIDRNIRFVPTPGHTPSHVSIMIESNGESALISGDFLYHPCQIVHPEWTAVADTLPEQAIETRVKMLEQLTDSETLLIGSHFANPVAGRIRLNNDNLTFET